METNFIPVLMGNDINVYSMARAFHEEYNLKSTVFCKSISGPCNNSTILELHADPKMDTKEIFLNNINAFAKENIDKTIILIGCGDSYVEVISKNLKELNENIIATYMEFSIIEPITDKKTFYEICKVNGIDFPSTFVYEKNTPRDSKLEFSAPYIIKPSDSVEYWRYPFEGQDKVFLVETKEELVNIVNKIFNSGYSKGIIIQEFIPGDDTNMRVMTSYSDKNGKVKFMALGHVLLEEHTPKGIGNHAVIINEYNEELYEKYRVLLENLNYRGFSNFDIKFDERDGKYKAFEINPRQGRSNYYVTNSGFNLAKMVVDEYIYGENVEGMITVSNEKLWMVIPKPVAFKYIRHEKYKQAMKKLIAEKQYVNPLFYEKDKSAKRTLSILKSQLSHFVKYKKYLGGK
ncbi:MAG: ATP-grasp domain-containing protein [Proteocatella sp.]